MMNSLEQDGLFDWGSATHDASGKKLIFHITKGAQKVLDERDFDSADADFDETKWKTFVFQKFGNAFVFWLDRAKDWPAKEINVVIIDSGDARKTSAAFAIDGVILVDVRAWHAVWVKHDDYISELAPAHEMTHIYQPPIGENRDRYRREFSAVLVELAYLRDRLETTDPQGGFGENDPFYQGFWQAIGTPTLAQIRDANADSHRVWRTMALVLESHILDGTYSVDSISRSRFATPLALHGARVKALEKFAFRYARYPAVGDAAFDKTARENGWRDDKNQFLTMKTLRADTEREVSRRGKNAMPAPAKTN